MGALRARPHSVNRDRVVPRRGARRPSCTRRPRAPPAGRPRTEPLRCQAPPGRGQRRRSRQTLGTLCRSTRVSAARCASASARRMPRRTSGAAAASPASLPPRRAGPPRRRDRRAGRRANRALARPRVRASSRPAACSVCEPGACARDLRVAREPACMGRACVRPAQAVSRAPTSQHVFQPSRAAARAAQHSVQARGPAHAGTWVRGGAAAAGALACAGAHTLRQACPRVPDPECFCVDCLPLDAQLQPGLRLCLAHRLRVRSRPVVPLSIPVLR